jgi:predicted Zn-dependent peptidase
MLDRVTAPVFQNISPFKLKEVQKLKLDNGRDVFFIDHGEQPIFKLELSIKSGSWYSEKYDLFSLALKSLNESSLKRSSSEITVAIDSLGAFIEFSPGFDNSSISIYGLTKHFHEIMGLLSEIIQSPKLDETEFETVKTKELERIRLNQEKNSYLSSIELRKNIFGAQHPYGNSATLSETESISIADVKTFFNSNFDDFEIFVSGKLPETFEAQLNDRFGASPVRYVPEKEHDINKTSSKDSNIIKANSVQSSINIGKRLFRRNHKDYVKFLVTNELLGGFFGSRLMKNIREEKGLTYGIYSHIYSLNNEGYFSVSTDCKGDFSQQVIDEVLKEIETLQSIPVERNELDTVKNYMLGSFTSSVSTPFALMDRFKAVYFQGLNYDYYGMYFDTVRNLTPDDIQYQSQEHLRLNSLITCSVGPNELY